MLACLLGHLANEQHVVEAVDAVCKAHPDYEQAIRKEADKLAASQSRAANMLRDRLIIDMKNDIDASSKTSSGWIGPYRLLDVIGQGAFGKVYKAERRVPVRQIVAIKVLMEGVSSRDTLARFHVEQRALASMSHQSIATLHDAGTTSDGTPYFVMELVEGLPVNAYCDRYNLSIRDRLGIFQDICGAVQHAHQKGIIHRDLKPDNVLVARDGEKNIVKVLDFGLAKAVRSDLYLTTLVTEKDQPVGTYAYMSPEQTGGAWEVVDARADIYSLGVILYEMLAGVLPLTSEIMQNTGIYEVLRMIREVDPPKPSERYGSSAESVVASAVRRRATPRRLVKELRGNLDNITMKALAKDREHRYAAAATLADDIQRHINQDPILAGPPSWAYRLTKYVRRRRILFSAMGLAMLMSANPWVHAYLKKYRANRLGGANILGQIVDRFMADNPEIKIKWEPYLQKSLDDLLDRYK
jgi:serine/threonine protein kinase